MNHRSSISPRTLLLALALAAAGANAAAQANLLVNGSFEAGNFTPDAKGVQDVGFGPPAPMTGWSTAGAHDRLVDLRRRGVLDRQRQRLRTDGQ